MTPHLKFHHLGLAVPSPDDARAFLAALGYNFGEPVFDPLQKVNLQICTHATEPAVELIWPGETPGGPLDAILRRGKGAVIYHICYSTDNLAAALESFETAGIYIKCVSAPQPAVLFGGRPVSFYQAVGMGLVEIVE
jgi:methylmalonyl-CoA/ethylmalonyl-CoA epimerase